MICSGVPDCHSAKGSEGNTGSKGVSSLSWETSDTGHFGVLPPVNSSHRQNFKVHRLVLYGVSEYGPKETVWGGGGPDSPQGF